MVASDQLYHGFAETRSKGKASLSIRTTSLAYAAQGFYLVASAGLNVLRRPFHATGLSILELFGIAIPLVLLGSHLFGLTGIFGGIGISYLATGAAAWIVVERVLVRSERELPPAVAPRSK